MVFPLAKIVKGKSPYNKENERKCCKIKPVKISKNHELPIDKVGNSLYIGLVKPTKVIGEEKE